MEIDEKLSYSLFVALLFCAARALVLTDILIYRYPQLTI
jgi:hypothetical protein